MSILDKTFTRINKVIKCLILSCFYVNILYVSVVLAKPPHEYLSNALKSVLKNFEENPRMLIPGGSMLLINYDKSKSISQDTKPIEQIPQPFVNTPPASATVNVSPNNLLRDSCDNCGTDLSDQNTDSLVERNDVPHIYKEVNLTTHDNYKVIDLDYDTDSLVEINDNSDNSSLIGSSGHDTSSLVEINDNSDNLFTSLDSTNTPSDSVISQDTEYVIPIDSHSNVNTMSPPVEGAVQEEPIIQKRAVILAAGIPRRDGGGVPSGGDGGGVLPGGDGDGAPPGGDGGGVPPGGDGGGVLPGGDGGGVPPGGDGGVLPGGDGGGVLPRGDGGGVPPGGGGGGVPPGGGGIMVSIFWTQK